MKPGHFRVLLLILLISTSTLAQPGPSQVEEKTPRLKITFNPPVIPADGRSYANVVVSLVDSKNEPLLALSPLLVHLASSRLDVGSVQETIWIQPLQAHAVATFRTTTTPGSTLITAAASGVLPDTQELITVIPSGFPVSLKVFTAPQVLPTGGGEATVYVQLQDVAGNPAQAREPLQVTLSTSPGIVTLRSRVLTIAEGNSLASTTLVTGFSTGTVTVSASATGFNTDSAVVSVVGPVAEKLVLQLTPPVTTPDSRGVITVQLQSRAGQPVRAPADVRVELTSDNPAVVLPKSPLIIRAGESYATTEFTTLFMGRATITASAQGYLAGRADARVVSPSSNPSGLKLYLAPSILLPDNRTHSTIYIQVQDARGEPALVPSDTRIFLASSDETVGSITPTVVIPRGGSFAIGNFTTTFKAGTTLITASAPGLKSDTQPMATFASLPTKLSITSAIPTLPADGNPYPSLVVQLLDEAGVPANAPTDLSVFLSSSRPDVGTPPPQATIPAGKSHILIPFQTTVTAGTTNVTAAILGFETGVATQRTVEPAPSRLAIYTLYPTLLATDSSITGGVVVQVQDSAGRPARARTLITVSLVSSNPALLTADSPLIIEAGSTYGSTTIRTYTEGGTLRLTAAAQGYISATTTIRVNPVGRNITLTIQPSPPKANQTATLTLTATIQGRPLTGARVTWELSLGQLVMEEDVVGPEGRATATIFSELAGPFEARAHIQMPGVINTTLTLSSSFVSPPRVVRPPPGPLEIIASSPPLLILIIGAPTAALILLLYYIRRLRRRRLEEALEEFGEEAPETRGG